MNELAHKAIAISILLNVALICFFLWKCFVALFRKLREKIRRRQDKKEFEELLRARSLPVEEEQTKSKNNERLELESGRPKPPGSSDWYWHIPGKRYVGYYSKAGKWVSCYEFNTTPEAVTKRNELRKAEESAK